MVTSNRNMTIGSSQMWTRVYTGGAHWYVDGAYEGYPLTMLRGIGWSVYSGSTGKQKQKWTYLVGALDGAVDGATALGVDVDLGDDKCITI
jgi:hypothetical protein